MVMYMSINPVQTQVYLVPIVMTLTLIIIMLTYLLLTIAPHTTPIEVRLTLLTVMMIQLQPATAPHTTMDKVIIISPADKGDDVHVVILSTARYIELAYNHLNANKTYQLLDKVPTMELVKRNS